MGKREVRQRLTAVRRFSGQRPGGPRSESDQSKDAHPPRELALAREEPPQLFVAERTRDCSPTPICTVGDHGATLPVTSGCSGRSPPPIVATCSPLSSGNLTRGGAGSGRQRERLFMPPQVRLAGLRQDSLRSRCTRNKTAASSGLVKEPAGWTLARRPRAGAIGDRSGSRVRRGSDPSTWWTRRSSFGRMAIAPAPCAERRRGRSGRGRLASTTRRAPRPYPRAGRGPDLTRR